MRDIEGVRGDKRQDVSFLPFFIVRDNRGRWWGEKGEGNMFCMN